MAKSRKESMETDDRAQPLAPVVDSVRNLILADIAMRLGSHALRRTVERMFLKSSLGETAEQETSLKKKSASRAGKIAAVSVPGAVVVGGGLLVKTLFDRSQKRRKARRAGNQALPKQAEE